MRLVLFCFCSKLQTSLTPFRVKSQVLGFMSEVSVWLRSQCRVSRQDMTRRRGGGGEGGREGTGVNGCLGWVKPWDTGAGTEQHSSWRDDSGQGWAMWGGGGGLEEEWVAEGAGTKRGWGWEVGGGGWGVISTKSVPYDTNSHGLCLDSLFLSV